VFIVVVAGGPRVGDLLAGAGTRILTEGSVLILGGVLCIAGAWVAARLQPGFRQYDARNPAP
jgi:ENTS family enterobactin (siderophore) exporter